MARAGSRVVEATRQLDRVIRGLQVAATAPARMVVRTHDSIMLSEDLPMYTGTYAGAIREEVTEDGSFAIVYMSVESLMQSAAEHGFEYVDEDGHDKVMDPHFYVYGVADPAKAEPWDWWLTSSGSEPYPLRLEEIGSPSYDKGAGLWDNAVVATTQMFLRESARIEALLTGKRTV